MSTTTLAQLETDLRDRLDEVTQRFWTSTELRRWLNEGARDVARRTECNRKKATINVVQGTADYPLPSDMVRVHKVEHARSSSDVWTLEYRDMASMDSLWSGYRTAQSRPVAYTIWGAAGGATMSVYPLPSETTAGGLIVWYYALPTAMSVDGSTLDLPEGWQDLPVSYAEYVAMRKDRLPNWQEAKADYEAKLQEMVNRTFRLTDQVGSYASEPAFVGLPAWLVDPDY